VWWDPEQGLAASPLGAGQGDLSGLSSRRLSLPPSTHSPGPSCQGCALFGSCLPPHLHQRTLRGLKRQARGVEGSSWHCWLENPLQLRLCPWLGQPDPPAVSKARPPPPSARPAGDMVGVDSWDRKPASLCLSFQPELVPLQSLTTRVWCVSMATLCELGVYCVPALCVLTGAFAHARQGQRP
jgi:hypothetical protein